MMSCSTDIFLLSNFCSNHQKQLMANNVRLHIQKMAEAQLYRFIVTVVANIQKF